MYKRIIYIWVKYMSAYGCNKVMLYHILHPSMLLVLIHKRIWKYEWETIKRLDYKCEFVIKTINFLMNIFLEEINVIPFGNAVQIDQIASPLKTLSKIINNCRVKRTKRFFFWNTRLKSLDSSDTVISFAWRLYQL